MWTYVFLVASGEQKKKLLKCKKGEDLFPQMPSSFSSSGIHQNIIY
jgi:hypothetical protein